MADTTVYTLPDCQPCKATKRLFEKLGVPYLEVSLLDAPADAQRLRDEGHATAPIVETPDRRWSGFRINEIREHAAELVRTGAIE